MAISEGLPSSRLRPSGSRQSDYICIDLLLLILRWFPVQTLLICRSVCKSWKQITDSATFKLDHLAHQIPRLLLQNHSFGYHLLDPDYVPMFDTITAPDGIDLGSEPSHLLAVGTIHGVVCLYDNNGDNLFLWNPSIRRHMRIPLPPSGFTASSSFKSIWSKYCGFWMDSCAKEFKVVIFYFGIDDHEDEKGGSVFSSRDQKWREIPKEEMAVFNDHYQTNDQSPQFLRKGVAYWIATDYGDFLGSLIVYYDFEQDKFGKIVLPQDVRNWSLDIQFSSVTSYDSLSIMVTTSYPGHLTGYETWVLRGGSWSTMDHVRPREDLGGVFAVLDWFNVLASNSDGLVALYRQLEDDLVPLFSTNDYDTKLNVKHGDKYLFSFSFDFVESLIFPY